MSGRWWSFTVNCVGDEVQPTIPNVTLTNGLKYYKFQKERCPDTGRLHYQGCLRFDNSVTMQRVKNHLEIQHVHLEVANKPLALQKYCGKEESRVDGPWEGGDAGQQGRRTDLASLAQMVAEGGGLPRVARENPQAVIQFGKGISLLHGLLHPPPVRRELKVFVLWGPTGTGKTRSAWELFPDLYNVFNLQSPWFDGYAGQNAILLDEMGPGMMDINFFKRILDIYPLMLPIKGGSVPMEARTIFITSNYMWQGWYPNASWADKRALERRFTQIYEIVDDPACAAALLDMRMHLDNIQGVREEAPAPAAAEAAPVSPLGIRAQSPEVFSVLDSDSDDSILDDYGVLPALGL